MFNTQKPSLEDLPRSSQLLRSTVIAAVSAAAILVAVVLPAEYGIDLTGAGGVLGLIEMGEIKPQLADEAEADRLLDLEATGGDQSNFLHGIFSLFAGAVHGQEAETWRDEATFTLAPGESAEWKLVMTEG